MVEFADDFEDGLGSPERRFALRVVIPCPAAVGHLKVAERLDDAVVLIFHLHLVEEFVEFRHAQGLSVSFLEPGRGEQCANLEVAVLGEH